MAKDNQRMFEQDRKMELRLRLAAKKAATREPLAPMVQLVSEMPEPEVVVRLINRVRRL
jgi:hypothetical protein